MKLSDFFARHAKPFLFDLAWMFPVVIGVFAVTLWGAVMAEPKEPQLYTVRFDGIEYQDLTRYWLDRGGSAYKTKTGKRIEFHGNFYEVEQ